MSTNEVWAHITIPVPVKLHVNILSEYSNAVLLSDEELYEAVTQMVQCAFDMGNATPSGEAPKGAYLSIGEPS